MNGWIKKGVVQPHRFGLVFGSETQDFQSSTFKMICSEYLIFCSLQTFYKHFTNLKDKSASK
jgi:hypothetical protein